MVRPYLKKKINKIKNSGQDWLNKTMELVLTKIRQQPTNGIKIIWGWFYWLHVHLFGNLDNVLPISFATKGGVKGSWLTQLRPCATDSSSWWKSPGVQHICLSICLSVEASLSSIALDVVTGLRKRRRWRKSTLERRLWPQTARLSISQKSELPKC